MNRSLIAVSLFFNISFSQNVFFEDIVGQASLQSQLCDDCVIVNESDESKTKAFYCVDGTNLVHFESSIMGNYTTITSVEISISKNHLNKKKCSYTYLFKNGLKLNLPQKETKNIMASFIKENDSYTFISEKPVFFKEENITMTDYTLFKVKYCEKKICNIEYARFYLDPIKNDK